MPSPLGKGDCTPPGGCWGGGAHLAPPPSPVPIPATVARHGPRWLGSGSARCGAAAGRAGAAQSPGKAPPAPSFHGRTAPRRHACPSSPGSAAAARPPPAAPMPAPAAPASLQERAGVAGARGFGWWAPIAWGCTGVHKDALVCAGMHPVMCRRCSQCAQDGLLSHEGREAEKESPPRTLVAPAGARAGAPMPPLTI